VPTNAEVALLERRCLEGPYFLLTFKSPEIARAARGGQFVMMKAGLSAEPPLRRPFSIMAVDPRSETFTLFVKAVGSGTRNLTDLHPGDAALCLGPLGRPFVAPPAGTTPFLVGGGYGVAPFQLFSRELKEGGWAPRVFYGGRTAADLVLRTELVASGIEPVLASEDGSLGHKGRVTTAVSEHLDALSGPAALYACGPGPMLRAVARLAAERGLPAQVSVDPWMGCGIGTCLGCVVPIQREGESRSKLRCACTEGPVFDARDVVWEAEGAE
jgi:dihydroorotate dehydrogenase electron transfer subunit